MNIAAHISRDFPDLESVRMGIEKIPSKDSKKYADEIVWKVRNGIAEVLEIKNETETVAHFVFEIYDKSLFVLASYAVTKEGKTVDIPGRVQHIIEKIAADRKCESISFQTSRPGLIKTASANGYEIKHVTMIKVLPC